jgi:hypothetical protein
MARSSIVKLSVVVLATLGVVFAVTLTDRALTQKFFVETTFYCLLVGLLCWAYVHLEAVRHWERKEVRDWVTENWRGIVVAGSLIIIAGLAVEPALRMLSDEANLVGTSKNFFASKSATFTVSGKYYYDSYWDVDVAIDRRPTLFPFLVSLVHSLVGYSYRNAFVFNLLVFPAFVFVAYRLAKSLGGETFGVVAALWMAAHPITLWCVRSAGFDFLAAFFGLLVLKGLLDFIREPEPRRLAMLWLNACLFAEVRYESALFLPLVVGFPWLFKLVKWSTLRPYALVYALTPVYLLPRIWQSLLRGNVPEQEPGMVAFSVENLANNTYEYFQPLLEPFHTYPAHCALLIGLGLIGVALWITRLSKGLRAFGGTAPELRFGLVAGAWMSLQLVIVFAYGWGRAQYPSAARLVLPVDIFFSFAAAWAFSRAFQRFPPRVTVLGAVAVLATQLPVASQARMPNRLTQTRESASTWAFFEHLNERRILIVTDRPSHFTIMNYGAMSFESARQDPHLLTAFTRHLFQDVYVVQQIKLSTNTPFAGYEIWPERTLDPVLEFQNDADVLVRISRVRR